MNGDKTMLQETDLETLMSGIGRVNPSISGSTAALIVAQIASAMARMALLVSNKHGSDNGLAVERLDSIVSRIKEAAERDREASSLLIDVLQRTRDGKERRRILRDATQEPLSGAHMIIELLELLSDVKQRIHPSVDSDFFGGIELLSGAFAAVIMAVDSNIAQDESGNLLDRTIHGRSSIRRRHDTALETLRSKLN